MYESEEVWRDVDRYFVDMLVAEDQALAAARRSSAETTMPQTEVAANQGKLLALLVGMVGADGCSSSGHWPATARSGSPVPLVVAAR
jgi:predicted O-methyltransferase YrrM